MKKKIILASITACLSWPLWAVDGLKVICSDGTMQTFLLKDRLTAKIIDNEFVIHNDTEELRISTTNYIRTQFCDIDPAEIPNVKSEETRFSFEGDLLNLYGISGKNEVALFSINGALLNKVYPNANGTVTISIPNPGFYIIKTNKTSIKIKKQ